MRKVVGRTHRSIEVPNTCRRIGSPSYHRWTTGFTTEIGKLWRKIVWLKLYATQRGISQELRHQVGVELFRLIKLQGISQFLACAGDRRSGDHNRPSVVHQPWLSSVGVGVAEYSPQAVGRWGRMVYGGKTEDESSSPLVNGVDELSSLPLVSEGVGVGGVGRGSW